MLDFRRLTKRFILQEEIEHPSLKEQQKISILKQHMIEIRKKTKKLQDEISELQEQKQSTKICKEG